ncbi:hypothetical protein HYH03_009638 [Edaphochlamys debaryana]|uniref:Uncharacterized protein n=1 Tax=Edaphochlamys debaryana TaxID=47281 RepID=A0A836BXM9_9CHLO|nr:hypothetical protein HYH03_009638 [Edaphochlamys debaryana]|eukprot:KAG2492147.1 hypothetical protein HYH03_009638 [Edaphochlamys debaryana]
MSSASVKKLLRSARECLGRREYREALQHCKEALAEDKSCYEAYIFVGKAAFHLGEHAQAEAAYRRASDLDPRNALAWQGLAELGAETGAWASAAECYGQLLALADAAPPGDPLASKRPTFLRRHAEAAARAGHLAAAEAAWSTLTDAAAAALVEAEAAAGVTAAGLPVAEAAAGGDVQPPAVAEVPAAVAAAEDELVECLCRLADVQLAQDVQELEARVAVRLAAEAEAAGITSPEQLAALEPGIRGAVEGEWAEEALEAEADHAGGTLRAIIARRPPSPPFAPYYDAFLKRLRKHIRAAPAGSMERHSRRAVLLAAARATMEGRCGDKAGGCCAPYAFEAALAMLEVEHEVLGNEDPSLDPAAYPPGSPPSLEPPPLPLLVADSDRIAARLAHAFPAAATAQLHTALALRRRAAAVGFDAVPTAESTVVVRLPPVAGGPLAKPSAAGAAKPAAAAAGGAVVGGRRRQVTRLLLSCLSRGARGVSGWLAACEALLQEGAPEAALDAAKEGLKYVAHREVVGKERLAGAGLLLRLLAGQALLRLRKLEEATALLEGLAYGVSEGHVASGELAGIPPLNVSQQAKRYLAHAAAARGDLPLCRQRYEELVGGALMGRSAAPIEAWAHGELGMLLLRQGAVEPARSHLEAALAALQPALDSAAAAAPAGTAAASLRHEAAAYRLHAALAAWAKAGGALPLPAPPPSPDGAADAADGAAATAAGGGGGGAPLREPARSACREHLLAAAGVAGPLQAAALAWLGRWYAAAAAAELGAGGDPAAARLCWQRALALDPTQVAEAGDALVAMLCSCGRTQVALALAQEMHARAAATPTPAAAAAAAAAAASAPPPYLTYPGLLPAPAAAAAAVPAAGGDAAAGAGAGWAARSLARLQRDAGSHDEAVTSYQAAIRLSPEDPELWEGLAASYQGLGRHTAALKSFGRALELAPGRLFSRLQAAALSYQMGDMPGALTAYRTALGAAPGNAAALLGCGEVLLAQAALAARMGAAGAAAAELAEAEALAARAAGLYGNLQAAWKLLGDVRMQHAAVPTAESVAATRGAAASTASLPGASAVASGLAAARARLAAVRQGRRAYAAAVHLDPRVSGLYGDLGLSYALELELAQQHPALQDEIKAEPSALRRRALALARGGLRLAPASDWLWGAAATVAAAGATGPPAADAAEMAGVAEYCYSRALQLNPRRAPLWAALGRLYAANGAGALASRCFDSARSHEPTSVAVWEAMGDSALRRNGIRNRTAADSGLLREAADAYEHAQLLGGDTESRLGFVLGALLLPRRGGPSPADGTVLAAATKAAAMAPLLPAAHHARALALEARGDAAEAVQAIDTAISLLSAGGDPDPAAAAAGAAPAAWPADSSRAPSAAAALRLDRARMLAAAGRAAEAVAAWGEAAEAAGLGPAAAGPAAAADPAATLAYGAALQQLGRSAEALPAFTALLSNPAAPPLLRASAATAAARIHVAARRWDEAYGVVLACTTDLPDEGQEGGGAAAEAGSKLWRVLLAGTIASRAPELQPQLLASARAWAAPRKDLDTAQHEYRLLELVCASRRAAAGPGPDGTAAAVAAVRAAAAAVRACPSDGAARALLAAAAAAAGPRYATLAARAAPRDHLPAPPGVSGGGPGGAADPVPGLAAPPPLAPSAAAAHAAGVTAAAAAAAAGGGGDEKLRGAIRAAAERMRRVVHSQPEEGGAWYLLAVTEMQLATASGFAVHLCRRAAATAAAAAARCRTQLAALPPDPPAAAAPRPPAPPPGMPPALALAMGAARAHAPPPPDPAAAALRLRRGALAEAAVRSLALRSEALLRLRERGGAAAAAAAAAEPAAAAGAAAEAAAAEAAQQALSLAQAQGIDASPAHRAMARLALAKGDWAAVDAAYDQACKAAAAAAATAGGAIGSASGGGGGPFAYSLLPALEWAAARAAAGRPAEALQGLDAAVSAAAGAPLVAAARPTAAAAPADVAAAQRALLLLQLGEAEVARAVAAEAAAGGGAGSAGAPAAALRSAAHTVQAAAALAAAAAAGDDAPTKKKALLEARWAAREALRPLTQARPAGQLGRRHSAPPPGPSGPGAALAAALLAAAEAALGKEEAAREMEATAAGLWPDTAADPAPGLEGLLAAAAARTGGSRLELARAVHGRPWALGEEWGALAAAARA